MSVCILDHHGEIVVHRNRKAHPDAVLKTIAPSRDHIVMAVECVFTWDGLAELCAREGLPFVLGHALDRQASHGGTATHAKIDAQQIAVWLRGGLLPQADVSPAAMRATRDLLRRRTHLMRKRAALRAHSHNTNGQDNLPEIGQQIADTANRHGVAERFPDPAVPKRIGVDLARLGHYDQRLRDVELSIRTTAKQHKAQTLYLRRTVPGIGELLCLGLLDEIHAIARFPRGQDCLSYGRLVKCTQASAGKRYGAAGTKRGNVPLTWAFSAAAVLFRRDNPVGQQHRTTLEQKHGSGKALTLLAQTLGRAGADMLQRQTACDLGTFLTGYGSGADEPNASLDTQGMNLRVVRGHACVAASVNASEHIGPLALIL